MSNSTTSEVDKEVAKKSSLQTGASVAIKVVNAMVGPEDPQNILMPASSVTPVATVTIAAADANALLYVQPLVSPISRYVRVIMTYTMGGTGGACNLTIGVNLVGRSA